MLKRVAVLCSHRAPGLLYLLNRAADRGLAYEVVCVVSSEETFDEEVRVERRGIPTRAHPMRSFGGSRQAYDAETVRILEPFMPDVILLDGYLYLVTEPLLAGYRSRIINLHFSDLTERTATGAPRFPGIRAVRDSIAAGCPDTRATVHLVDEFPDAGPPLVRSWPFPVSPLIESIRTLDAPDVFKAYVYAHQQWMMRTVSGPLINAALRLIASGEIDLDARAAAPLDEHAPWLLDQQGALLAPELEFA
ncbi:MAG TPA: formyltransferase family protein [Vicinamibacterales bacterium]|nr:formyltransferase family protein [Vicinamibacterales bacterium]